MNRPKTHTLARVVAAVSALFLFIIIDEPIYVTNRELIMILGTPLVTVLWDLNIAVGLFTALFYVHNKLLVKTNPMRDLKPVETEAFTDEV